MEEHTFDKEKMQPAVTAEKIHERLLLMLKELHRICAENNITYYMLGGTALGARRHHGFIPWDDDADIGMPRLDYERFAQLTRDKFPNFLELRWYRNTNNSPFQFIKLIDNRTTLVEKAYDNYFEGLYIDIFPLDGVKSGSFIERVRCTIIWTLHKMVTLNQSSPKKNNIIKKILVKYIKTFNLQKLHSKLEKLLIKVSYDEGDLSANFLGAWGKHEIVEKRYFGTPQLYTFEDSLFYGPEMIDDYLKQLYGNFMLPPPPEERVFRHNYSILNFDIPFRKYEENVKIGHE